jgi:hypothetical protein
VGMIRRGSPLWRKALKANGLQIKSGLWHTVSLWVTIVSSEEEGAGWA